MLSTGQIAMRRQRTLDEHVCNAYCRGNHHAQVIDLSNCSAEDGPDALREWCANVGVSLVHCEPAKEDDGGRTGVTYELDGRKSRDRDLPGDVWTPWLCIWALPIAAAEPHRSQRG